MIPKSRLQTDSINVQLLMQANKKEVLRQCLLPQHLARSRSDYFAKNASQRLLFI